MTLLSHDAFIVELSKLYEISKSKGSVWVTFKKLSPEKQKKGIMKADRNKGPATGDDSNRDKSIVRATNGKKKISCIVSYNDKAGFHDELMSITKAMISEKLQRKIKKSRKTGKGNQE